MGNRVALPFMGQGRIRDLFNTGLTVKLKWHWFAKLYQFNINFTLNG